MTLSPVKLGRPDAYETQSGHPPIRDHVDGLQGVFSAMTDKQVAALSTEIVQDLKKK
jgi:hypothetical protein